MSQKENRQSKKRPFKLLSLDPEPEPEPEPEADVPDNTNDPDSDSLPPEPEVEEVKDEEKIQPPLREYQPRIPYHARLK